jgi:hypothetical protein
VGFVPVWGLGLQGCSIGYGLFIFRFWLHLSPHFWCLRFQICGRELKDVHRLWDMDSLTCGVFGWLFGKNIIFEIWWGLPLLIWAWRFQWCTQNREIMLFKEGWLLGLTFEGWLFELFCFIAAVEHGTRIPEWYGTCQSDLLWRSYGWMKFIYFGLHPLIAHALGVQWPSALCFWNTLWGAYNVVHLLILFNGASIWSNMFRVWV